MGFRGRPPRHAATVEKASRPRLRRSDLAEPGIRRVKHGRGFRYLLPDGEAVIDPRIFDRFRDGETLDTTLVGGGGRDSDEAAAIQGPAEKPVLKLLEG